MINMFRAELLKLSRQRILAATAGLVLVSAAVATIVVFLSASDAASTPLERGTSIATLSGSGGGTEAFSIGMSFTGFFVFVVLTANWALEFSQGTFRMLLMKQPERLAVLAGKLAALLAFAAVVLLAGEALTWGLSLAIAPSRGISTAHWFGPAAMRSAAANYGNAFLGVAAWSSFAMLLAVLLRSVPLALGAGIGWAGPFEHLTQRASSAVAGWYPGLLLEALAVGGTSDASYGRVLTMLAIYLVLAIAAAALLFARRDVSTA